MSPHCPNCAEMQEELTELRLQMAYELDRDLAQKIQQGLGVTGQMANLLAGLYRAKGRPLSAGRISDLLPPISLCGRERDATSIATVYVCKTRRVLGAGIIGNVHGQGYHLTPAGMALVADATRSEQTASEGSRAEPKLNNQNLAPGFPADPAKPQTAEFVP